MYAVDDLDHGSESEEKNCTVESVLQTVAGMGLYLSELSWRVVYHVGLANLKIE